MATAFFGLGHFMHEIKIRPFMVVILMFSYSLFIIVYPSWVDMLTMKVICGDTYLWYLQSLIAILVVNRIAKKFCNWENIFAKLGRNTLPIFCLHWPVIILISLLLPSTHTKYSYLVTLILGNGILLPVIIFGIKKSKFRFLID